MSPGQGGPVMDPGQKTTLRGREAMSDEPKDLEQMRLAVAIEAIAGLVGERVEVLWGPTTERTEGDLTMTGGMRGVLRKGAPESEVIKRQLSGRRVYFYALEGEDEPGWFAVEAGRLRDVKVDHDSVFLVFEGYALQVAALSRNGQED